jgi:hypothetical protein
VPNSNSLQKVLDHLQLYEHPLLAFSARENNGVVEVLIDLKNLSVPVHTYVLPIHARDLDHPQFAWHLQHQLYDGLHDYFIEMFIRTPQDRSVQRPTKADATEVDSANAGSTTAPSTKNREDI